MMKPRRSLVRIARWAACAFVCGLCLVGCEPPAPPDGENPPCLTEALPKQGTVIPRENVTFTLTFSKALEPETISEETIYLARDEIDLSFLRNLESTSAVTSSRQDRLVPLEIDRGDNKKITVKSRITLRGDTTYQLVLTRRLRDALVDLGENRFSGSRPLNSCADATTKIWTGSVDDYKSGFSVILTYRTEPEPPRPGTPRIVESMANPPTGQAEYVEIQNVHASESLDLCGLSISDGGTAREIVSFDGKDCPKIGPGKRAVLIEPDYDIRGNPYGIPSSAVILTITGSSTTLLSGGLSGGEPVQLLNGDDLLEQISPSTVAGGVWPSGGKSLEKCDASGSGSDPSNWGESADGGSPGKANTATCP